MHSPTATPTRSRDGVHLFNMVDVGNIERSIVDNKHNVQVVVCYIQTVLSIIPRVFGWQEYRESQDGI